MNFIVVYPTSIQQPAQSPFALSSRRPAAKLTGSIGTWIASTFAAWRTRRLRTYAHDLLHFLRWWESVHHTDDVAKVPLPNRHCWIMSDSSPPTTSAFRLHHQHRVAIVDRALRNEFPDAPCQIAPGFHQDLLAARAHGPWQTTAGPEPVAGEGPQTHHRAAVGGRSGAVLVQFPYLARPGHRRLDAAARAPVGQEVLDSESGRSCCCRKRRSACAAKATRLRFLPLAPEAIQLLDHYLRLERPDHSYRRFVRFSQGTRRAAPA